MPLELEYYCIWISTTQTSLVSPSPVTRGRQAQSLGAAGTVIWLQLCTEEGAHLRVPGGAKREFTALLASPVYPQRHVCKDMYMHAQFTPPAMPMRGTDDSSLTSNNPGWGRTRTKVAPQDYGSKHRVWVTRVALCPKTPQRPAEARVQGWAHSSGSPGLTGDSFSEHCKF